jgi:subtilisin family serine protease
MRNIRREVLLLLLLTACGAPPEEALSVEQPVELGQTARLLRSERAIPGQYIVALRGGPETLSAAAVSTAARELAARHGGSVLFTYQAAFQGFAMRMPAARAQALLEDPRVAYVEEDSTLQPAAVQSTPPWGLDRIDERFLPMDNFYRYSQLGTGVNAYVIDSGIRLTHAQFGGRAVTGYDAVTPGGTATDCQGHGTAVASVIGGSTLGIAKSAKLYAVRVMDCNGSGSTSGLISAIDWVRLNHVKPAVAVMSMTLLPSTSLDTAVNNAINGSGILFIVAAGNDNANACNYSPARIPAAFTISATTPTDARASFANFGSCVDLFAPGATIPVATSTSNTASTVLSGTSFAAAHVAGAAVLHLQANPSATPSGVVSAIMANATTGVMSGGGVGSPNTLLYVPPPVVSIVSPLGGSVGGTVSINALTSESVAVNRVEFFVGATSLGSDTSAPYSLSWNTVPHAGGVRTLTAKAFNGATLVGTSETVSVTVQDITPPTLAITSPAAGAVVSGNVPITVSTSDNVGVVRVDFYVDSTLVGSDSTAPFAFTWNSASVALGAHTLSARALDAAGNLGTSPSVPVTVGCGSSVQLLDNPGFESGNVSWVSNPSGVINNFNLLHPPRTGSFKATLGGAKSSVTSVFQEVLLPSSFCQAELSFWMKIDTIDSLPNDSLTVTVRDTSGAVLVSAAQFSNLEPGFASYAEVRLTLPLGPYAGSFVRIQLESQEDSANTTSFFIDDTALTLSQ